jgi:hypothetical protein
MKKATREDAAGLQGWLSYQARTREVAARPESDIIDWDEGIEVQEEWLTREQCEQRMREETERKLVPVAKSLTPVVEVEDIALASPPPLATAPVTAAEEQTTLKQVEISKPVEIGPIEIGPTEIRPTEIRPTGLRQTETKSVEFRSAELKSAEIKGISPRDTSSREIKSKPAAPAQFETHDLASAVPAFHR